MYQEPPGFGPPPMYTLTGFTLACMLSDTGFTHHTFTCADNGKTDGGRNESGGRLDSKTAFDLL